MKSLDIGILTGSSIRSIYFIGEPPVFDAKALRGITATLYYPKCREGWNSNTLKSYGGNITFSGYTLSSHIYKTTITPPTCTLQGYTSHVCNCGYSYNDTYVSSLGHSYTSTVIPPTETDQGYTQHICIRCSDSYKDSFTPPITSYLKGDIDGDGKVNNLDAARLMQYIAGWDVVYIEAALDTNDDGKVNNLDAARLMQYIAGWDVELH